MTGSAEPTGRRVVTALRRPPSTSSCASAPPSASASPRASASPSGSASPSASPSPSTGASTDTVCQVLPATRPPVRLVRTVTPAISARRQDLQASRATSTPAMRPAAPHAGE
jgi:hypothetical protein